MAREIHASYWHCGDEDCNCWQPQISEYSTEPFRHPSWKPPTEIATGPFYSEPEKEEWLEMILWMEKECKERGLELPQPPYDPRD